MTAPAQSQFAKPMRALGIQEIFVKTLVKHELREQISVMKHSK